MTLPSAFKIKRGLAAGLPALADGEPGWTTDTNTLYIGQGGVNYAIGGSGVWQPLDAMLTGLAALSDPGADRIVFWDDSAGDLAWLEAGSGISISGTTISVSASGVDHGGLTGLGDDDHTQYVLLAGRSGGQNLHGGTGSADDLILESTSHGTKGYIRCVDGVHVENRLLLNEATASLTGSVNNWAPTGLTSRSRVEITADGNYNITGIDSSGHAIGGLLLLVNADATNTITLKDESASSSAANRFSLSADYVLQPGEAIALLYSTELTRWVSLSGDGATSYTDEEAQDAVGGILADTDTVNATYTDATPELKFDVRTQLSITSDASGIKLSGDSASPGNSYYYGTDSGGTKGYFALPTYQPLDAMLTSLAALTDPGADRIAFWDDSVGDIGWLEAGSGLSIFGNTITATALSDGDKGDITVSASGATWTIDANAVSYSKIQAVNANRLLGRPNTGGGTVMEIELNATLGFFSSAIGIAANAVTGAYFRQSAAYSVVGNATGSTTDVTDISATNGSGMGILTFNDTTNGVSFFQSTTAGFVKSNGSALSVGTISLSDLPTLTVTEIPALNGFTDAEPDILDVIPGYDASDSANRDFRVDRIGGLIAPRQGGRLTLLYGDPDPVDQSGGAVPTSTNTTAETVTFTSAHGWSTGQGVSVSATGGGLTAGTIYYARATSTTAISFHPTLADANANTNAVNLTASITATVVPAIHLEECEGGYMVVWDGTRLAQIAIPDGLAVLASSSTDTNFDIFAYSNSGTLALEITNWSSSTAGSSSGQTALAWRNGLRVKSSDHTRLFLGTGRTTTVAYQCCNYGVGRPAKLFLSNYYHDRPRDIYVAEPTDSWTYTTLAWRNANGSASNRAEIVNCKPVHLDLMLLARADNSAGSSGSAGIGENSSNNDARLKRFDNFPLSIIVDCTAFIRKRVSAGYHYYQWTEISNAAGTTTWYGDGGGTLVQSGLNGWVMQ